MNKYNFSILLPVYVRIENLKETLLIVNQYKFNSIYIFRDLKKDKSELEKIKDYLQSRIWNNKIMLFEWSEHVGLRKNIESGLNFVFETEQIVLTIEDDAIPNENLFNFMEIMKTKLNYDEEISHISGYTAFNNKEKSTEFFEIYWSHYPNTYCWMTNQKSWKLYNEKIRIKQILIFLKNSLLYDRTFLFGLILILNLYLRWLKKLDSWAMKWLFVLNINHKKCIEPSKNFIEYRGNISGTHTKLKPKYKELNDNSSSDFKNFVFRNSEEIDNWKIENIYRGNLKGFFLNILIFAYKLLFKKRIKTNQHSFYALKYCNFF